MNQKKQIRNNFRTAVFERDNYTCQVCGRKWNPEDADPNLGWLNSHHIQDRTLMPNGGYVAENGITVCDIGAFKDGSKSCHMRVEAWWQSNQTQIEEGLHPEDLYRKIGSSRQEALRKSCLLK